jgi:hypothetical protein
LTNSDRSDINCYIRIGPIENGYPRGARVKPKFVFVFLRDSHVLVALVLKTTLNFIRVLTYMSIRDVINSLDGERLFLLTPALDSDPTERFLFVSKDIHDALEGAGEGDNERMGRLREHLEVFVRGEIVTVAMEPFRAKDAYMARLHPPRGEVWEIRDRSGYSAASSNRIPSWH